MRCTKSVGCGRAAVWRISVPTDPWPLQYGCDLHVLSIALDLGGDVRIAHLEPGQTTPQPRVHIQLGPVGLRVLEDPTIPPGTIRVVPGHRCGATLATGGTCMTAVKADGDRCHRHPADPALDEGGQTTTAPVEWVPAESCPAAYTTASRPRVSVTCELGDTREAHAQGIHRRDLGDRVCRWPVTDFDRHRWRVSAD